MSNGNTLCVLPAADAPHCVYLRKNGRLLKLPRVTYDGYPAETTWGSMTGNLIATIGETEVAYGHPNPSELAPGHMREHLVVYSLPVG